MRTYLTALAVTIAALATASAACANVPPRTAERTAFRHDRFGLLVAYGAWTTQSTLPNPAAWRTGDPNLTRAFKPNPSAVRGWCVAAQKAGAKYLTFTTRWHDGYALWNTTTEWHSPIDLVKIVTDECRRRNIKVFLYYSLLDYHDAAYGYESDSVDFPRYLTMVRTQLRELLTRYGHINGLWFDGSWDAPKRWDLPALYRYARSFQPALLIATNHHELPKPGEDFQIFEEAFPGIPSLESVWNTPFGWLPYETAVPFTGSWEFKQGAHPVSTKTQLLAAAQSASSNLLLGIGPMPDGAIPPDVLAALAK